MAHLGCEVSEVFGGEHLALYATCHRDVIDKLLISIPVAALECELWHGQTRRRGLE